MFQPVPYSRVGAIWHPMFDSKALYCILLFENSHIAGNRNSNADSLVRLADY